MNEVVVNVFSTSFWGFVVANGYHNDAPSCGGAGVPPGGGGVRSTCQGCQWVDSHCEIRHINVNHCLNTVKELQL